MKWNAGQPQNYLGKKRKYVFEAAPYRRTALTRLKEHFSLPLLKPA